MTIGTCPKCKEDKELTRHHLSPVTHYGKIGLVELICRLCHDELEEFLEECEGKNSRGRRNKLPVYQYAILYYKFIAV